MMRNGTATGSTGQAMVEFAALAVVFFTLVFGIFELSRAFYYYASIVNGASEGTRFGTTNQTYGSVSEPCNPSQITSIRNAVHCKAVGLNLTDSDIIITCPDGACSVDKRIQVSVNYTFTAVAPFVPSFPLSGSSTMRIDFQFP